MSFIISVDALIFVGRIFVLLLIVPIARKSTLTAAALRISVDLNVVVRFADGVGCFLADFFSGIDRVGLLLAFAFHGTCSLLLGCGSLHNRADEIRWDSRHLAVSFERTGLASRPTHIIGRWADAT